MKGSTWAWIAAAAAAVGGGLGLYFYEKKKTTPATPAAIPVANPTLTAPTLNVVTGGLQAGSAYVFNGLVPSGITTPSALSQALAASGWSGTVVPLRILWFGPTRAIDHTASIIDAPTFGPEMGATSFVAVGQWQGTQNSPIPAGVNFYTLD